LSRTIRSLVGMPRGVTLGTQDQRLRSILQRDFADISWVHRLIRTAPRADLSFLWQRDDHVNNIVRFSLICTQGPLCNETTPGELTCQPDLCWAKLRQLPSARRYGSNSCCLIVSNSIVKCSFSTHTKGCSTLKIFEVVCFEKGILESSMGEDPVDDLEGIRSGLFVPFCGCLCQSLQGNMILPVGTNFCW